MICPYNGFKEMDCSACGAYVPIANPSKSTLDMKPIKVCGIAYMGGTVNHKPIIALQGGAPNNEWR